MKTVGIIAEYNPFHNGHKYQIEKAKALTGADRVVVILSGDFVQRGAPAIMNKYLRTQMALENGADLVLELPAIYATASAELFAMGAVSILDKAGIIDYLCFGSECGDMELLMHIANILVAEPEEYQAYLKDALQKGVSFPAARIYAMLAYHEGKEDFGYNREDMTSLLSSPNNILGLEYCKALLKRSSSITPVTITRIGAQYHDTNLNTIHASATALREALLQTPAGKSPSIPSSHVPDNVAKLLFNEYNISYPVTEEDFSSLLMYRLLTESSIGFASYLDVSRELSDRIINQLHQFQGSFSQFAQLLKTKDLTYTRITRSLFHILLQLKKKDMDCFQKHDFALYLRPLGFKRDASMLLSAMKANSTIPILSKLADAKNYLNHPAKKMLEQDILAAHIYESVLQHKFAPTSSRNGGNEYTRQIIIFPH